MEGEDHEEAGAARQKSRETIRIRRQLIETWELKRLLCQAQNGRRSSHDDNYSPLDLLPSICPVVVHHPAAALLLPSAAAAAAGKVFSGPGNMRLRRGPPLVKMALAVLATVLASMAPAVPRGRCDDAARAVVARSSIFVSRKGGADFTSVQDAVDSVPFGNGQWIRVHVAPACTSK